MSSSPVSRGFLGALVAALASAGAAELFRASVDGAGRHVFHVRYDPHSSEVGAYKFAECGGEPIPTLAMERGVTYTFQQSDVTNWFHPLGFAYGPDGNHRGNDELEPGRSLTNSPCAENETDFGLDAYEPAFFASRNAWANAGAYSVELTLTDFDYSEDLFYFCHIHNSMSGRIKMTAGGVPVHTINELFWGYEYNVVSAYDAECGTDGLDARLRGCLSAMDYAMQTHMRSRVHDTVPITTFIHQMVLHHQNAVNIAKALLQTMTLDANDADDAIMTDVLWSMINEQTYQIHAMRSYLQTKGYEATGACEDGDSASWHKRGDTSKDCAWVAAYAEKRCRVKDKGGVEAGDACMAACMMLM
ncbi:hypothetical protein M885DRAFT_568405 [Pelagophyceae sp. CCMP2097]|nr:hypothetical protein M885DRAFT_568405 [Pelagophyceae sp. CCMP2097]